MTDKRTATRTKPLGKEFTLAGDYAELAAELDVSIDYVAWSIVNNDDGTHTLVGADVPIGDAA